MRPPQNSGRAGRFGPVGPAPAGAPGSEPGQPRTALRFPAISHAPGKRLAALGAPPATPATGCLAAGPPLGRGWRHRLEEAAFSDGLYGQVSRPALFFCN